MLKSAGENQLKSRQTNKLTSEQTIKPTIEQTNIQKNVYNSKIDFADDGKFAQVSEVRQEPRCSSQAGKNRSESRREKAELSHAPRFSLALTAWTTAIVPATTPCRPVTQV